MKISIKFKMLNVTHNDAVTIAHGLHGQIVLTHVVVVFKNEPLMTVTVLSLIEKSAPILL